MGDPGKINLEMDNYWYSLTEEVIYRNISSKTERFASV
jgi:hypothetical protein